MAEVRQAGADEVRAATGFAIGGVPPFGHDLPVILDQDLLLHERVWAAAATRIACSPSTLRELARCTKRAVAAVGSDGGG